MTQKEIAALTLSASGDGGFALCKKTRTGKLVPVREFANAEITTVLSLMYAKHLTDNPEEKIMLLPMDDKGNALAVTFAQIGATKKEVKG